ncbi:unnamed protein product [Pleuronectes platessa]|uniref:Uncharacterized protein n=1 Tax=Pleuronectes platessa TaxID=8262 RepID=A0A9N7UPW5_PLEPL|nr:unnamed protein product [Pleuronectes platessa]
MSGGRKKRRKESEAANVFVTRHTRSDTIHPGGIHSWKSPHSHSSPEAVVIDNFARHCGGLAPHWLIDGGTSAVPPEPRHFQILTWAHWDILQSFYEGTAGEALQMRTIFMFAGEEERKGEEVRRGGEEVRRRGGEEERSNVIHELGASANRKFHFGRW